MRRTSRTPETGPAQTPAAWTIAAVLSAGLVFHAVGATVQPNLLKNAGLEETASASDSPPGWTTRTNSTGRAQLTDKEAHGGRYSLAIPAKTAVEQQVDSADAGAYLARCWVKSSAEQSVTVLLQDPDRPWAAYSCAEIKVPRDQWTRVEVFCALDQKGSLTFTLGGMSQEFRSYHGAGAEMGLPILADDFELVRYEPNSPSASTRVAVWDTKTELGSELNWSTKDQWSPVGNSTHAFAGTPVVQGRHLVGSVRKQDGALMVYAVQEGKLKPRCVITPSPALASPKCTLVQLDKRTGVQISSASGDRRYTAWLTPKGLMRIEAEHVPQFQLRNCRLSYGLLPSFTGTDVCYAAAKLPKDSLIPSTQWFVGLGDSQDNMLVAVWDSDSQAVSLGAAGEGESRLIDSLSIATGQHGFALSFVEHPALWQQETLKEDWLGEYTPLGWQRPFPARWMAHFFVTPGGKPTFRQPNMGYSFPIAWAKTRMWGVWFEDWNYYPFYFDGSGTIAHFDKTFVPNGNVLFYFLEPAAADLYSPCEILEQALGYEKAAALLDSEANRLRKLQYSTPDQFMFDRPVCATTTRLSKIKKEDKATVGIDLATHLYEFIREIRSRVDQYGAFFAQTKDYLAAEKKAHPELGDFLAELDGMVAEAQARSQQVYAMPLSSVQQKIESMKKLLQEGKEDGFDCGQLDVRTPAGNQDDLCRHYNRLVMRLVQTAALNCADSPEKALVAKHLWDQSRSLLRRPTRWESRRTLYFFEP